MHQKIPLIVRKVATAPEVAVLRDWAMRNYESGLLKKNQTVYRNYNAYGQLPPCEIYEEIRARFAKRVGLENVAVEPYFGDFLSVIYPGGFVQPHTDPAVEGCYHARANLVCQKPDGGGMPIIDGERYEMEPGDMWIFLASEALHWTDKVAGSKPRITCSFGWAAPRAWWDNLDGSTIPGSEKVERVDADVVPGSA